MSAASGRKRKEGREAPIGGERKHGDAELLQFDKDQNKGSKKIIITPCSAASTPIWTNCV